MSLSRCTGAECWYEAGMATMTFPPALIWIVAISAVVLTAAYVLLRIRSIAKDPWEPQKLPPHKLAQHIAKLEHDVLREPLTIPPIEHEVEDCFDCWMAVRRRLPSPAARRPAPTRSAPAPRCPECGYTVVCATQSTEPLRLDLTQPCRKHR